MTRWALEQQLRISIFSSLRSGLALLDSKRMVHANLKNSDMFNKPKDNLGLMNNGANWNFPWMKWQKRHNFSKNFPFSLHLSSRILHANDFHAPSTLLVSRHLYPRHFMQQTQETGYALSEKIKNLCIFEIKCELTPALNALN